MDPIVVVAAGEMKTKQTKKKKANKMLPEIN